MPLRRRSSSIKVPWTATPVNTMRDSVGGCFEFPQINIPAVSQWNNQSANPRTNPRSSQPAAQPKVMIDKTETAFQGLVNLAGANIAMGSIRSNDRRLKVAKRKRTTGTASSATLNTQLPHSHSLQYGPTTLPNSKPDSDWPRQPSPRQEPDYLGVNLGRNQ